MSEINAELVKDLRNKTGAGVMACKEALREAKGNLDAAVDYLRKKGLKDVEKRAGRVAAEGLVYSYIHPGSRIGVLLELNCETDFVARGEDFKRLAHDIAMHVAWAAPKFLDRESVSESILEREREIFRSQLKPEQEKMAEKILAGKLEKFFAENCLLEQADARDSTGKQTIGGMAQEVSAKVGEKVVLRRFARFEIGTDSARMSEGSASTSAAAS